MNPSDHTQPDIQQSRLGCALLHGAQRLALEGREGGVGADESDRNQVAPVRTGRGPRQQAMLKPIRNDPLMLMTNVP